MTFRIVDSFSDSLIRLTAQEQKAAKTAAIELQMSPDNPGLSLHGFEKLTHCGTPTLWRIRSEGLVENWTQLPD